MSTKIYLVTPPFTQLNTPYPATAYLKGFLNTKGITSYQSDLGIEVILHIFSKHGLQMVFDKARVNKKLLSNNARRIVALEEEYIRTIDEVIGFLQGRQPMLAHLIGQSGYLPEAARFDQLDDLEWAFGSLGIQDKAKHLATLYLEDLADLIKEAVDEHFGFSRYAERLGRSANSFDELYGYLQSAPSFTDLILWDLLENHITQYHPDLIAVSVPFPGNLYGAFRIAQWIKEHHPHIKMAMGGGFPNTELRSVSDSRVFEFFDFITLDDGEAPIEHLVQYLEGKRPLDLLKRTFVCNQSVVQYINGSLHRDYKYAEIGTPDYSGLPLDRYISVLEVANPMHRMWSDGRWNKLTMAHGCYWGKCTFCDISLDYIQSYEPVAASIIVDRMETLIQETGDRGFHFVDEAAPPALMRAVAQEILKRKLTVAWWTNIRFEKSFTFDLCRLLKASGCVAVSGGLEVASDRLLGLIDKGVTVAQVASVTGNFTEAGILVHAYLMYGFPTQTDQETIDSLEMVRQMFEAGIIQSGFWHQFAMTAHSPVGLHPEKFKVTKIQQQIGAFANNDLEHEDPLGADHDRYSYGLKKSLFNYMHGVCFEFPLQEWFDFEVPNTTVEPDFIQLVLSSNQEGSLHKSTSRVLWLGPLPTLTTPKGTDRSTTSHKTIHLVCHTKLETISIPFSKRHGYWLLDVLKQSCVNEGHSSTLSDWKGEYESSELFNFDQFWESDSMDMLRDVGLLVI